jgi:putative SOS response-associated peptidase YedK
MCGRFHLKSSPNEILEHYSLDASAMAEAPVPSGEVFPGTSPFVVSASDGGVRFGPMFWGFRPFRVEGTLKQPINAKVETLFSSGYWKSSAQSRRCLVPVNTWDEWQQKPGQPKQRWRIEPAIESALFSLGGIYVSYKNKNEQPVTGFAIITQPAADSIDAIHHRQPLIVMPDDYQGWLEAETPEVEVQRLARRQGRNYETCHV